MLKKLSVNMYFKKRAGGRGAKNTHPEFGNGRQIVGLSIVCLGAFWVVNHLMLAIVNIGLKVL